MRIGIAFASVLIFAKPCIPQAHRNPKPFPTEVVIGRDSFIDVGPPFNYYDLTFLRSDGDRTEVDRISLTPPADKCYPPPEIEEVALTLDVSLFSLFEGTNPCTIPEKSLKAELKRRRKGLPVFSGMNVSMQVECSGRTRVIRADILDRDIFDEHPITPQYTAWSQSLFKKLDEATGNTPWQKPVFQVEETGSVAPPAAKSAALQAIGEGKFDAIFGDAPDRPSALYRMAQNAPRQPFIELTKSDPVKPMVYVDPLFPPIAKAAHVHGTVEFHLAVAADGTVQNVTIDSGPKMLWQAVSDASTKWKFSPDDTGKVVHGSIRFGLNCASDVK